MSAVLLLSSAELPVPTTPAAMGWVSRGDTVSLPCILMGQERGKNCLWLCGCR